MNLVERLIFGGWRLISLFISFPSFTPTPLHLKRKFDDINPKLTLRRTHSYHHGLHLQYNEDEMVFKKRKTRKSYGHFVYMDETRLMKGDDFDFI